MIARMYVLRISPFISNEWAVRCIGDVIPAFADQHVEAGRLRVSEPVLLEILADCRFMENPKCVDATVKERRAYRELADQCERALRVGPLEA